MNTAKELHERIMRELKKYEMREKWMEKVDRDSDFYAEMTDRGGKCKFYKWLACLVKVTKPLNVCELGAFRGGSAIFILSELPKKGLLYSIDIQSDDGEAWMLVPEWDERIRKIPDTDDTYLSKVKDVPWGDIDIWFVDSLHEAKHVEGIMDFITKNAKPGAIILNHDIYLNSIKDVLVRYPWDFWEDEKEIFNNGIGVHVMS